MAANDTSFRSLSRILSIGAETGWVLFGQAGMAVGAIFTVKILTSVLGPAEFGRLMLANTLILAVSGQVFGPLAQGVMRFWSVSRDQGILDVFLVHCHKYNVLLTSWILAIGVPACGVVCLVFGVKWGVPAILALMAGVCTGWTGTRLAVLMAARDRKTVALALTGAAFFKPLAGMALVLLFFPEASWVLFGYLIATGSILLVIEKIYRRRIGVVETGDAESACSKERGLGKDIISYALPFFIWGVFGWINESCDRWALQGYFGEEVVGAFSVVSQLSVYPLILISGFLGMLFSPIAYERAGSLVSLNGMRNANRLLFIMASIYILFAFCLILTYCIFHEYVVVLISNSSYAGLSWMLPYLTAAWTLYYFGQTLTGYGMLANRPRVYILPKITTAIIAVSLCLILPSKFGPFGIVLALVASGFVYSLWCLSIAFYLTKHTLSFVKKG